MTSGARDLAVTRQQLLHLCFVGGHNQFVRDRHADPGFVLERVDINTDIAAFVTHPVVIVVTVL